MVDFESYFLYGPSTANVGPLTPVEGSACGCIECQEHPTMGKIYRSQFDKVGPQKEWEDEQYILCPPRVLGCILRHKQWAQLQVTSLRSIPKVDRGDSWARVKLADGEETKKMILNLVRSHGMADSKDDDSGLRVDDIVAEKGKGLVILLYGMSLEPTTVNTTN